MKHNPWPKGLLTALVTPLKNDRVDLEQLARLVDYQVDSGVAGLVVTGGSGEHGALSLGERTTLIREVAAMARGRVPVIAATGCFSTGDTLALCEAAEAAGAAGILLASPFGEPINWQERYAFYSAVAKRVKLPIMIYNTPPAGLLNLEQIQQLAELPNICAVKDSSGDPELMGDLTAWAAESGVAVYVGKDSYLCEALVSGARGAVFGVANFMARELSGLIREIQAGGATPANIKAWRKLRPLLRFLEKCSNYVAFCKLGCAVHGIDAGHVRAPYLMPGEEERESFRRLIDRFAGR